MAGDRGDVPKVVKFQNYIEQTCSDCELQNFLRKSATKKINDFIRILVGDLSKWSNIFQMHHGKVNFSKRNSDKNDALKTKILDVTFW